MRLQIIFVASCCLIYLQLCTTNATTTVNPTSESETLKNLVSRNEEFSNNFVKALLEDQRNNYVSSPLSAWFGLTMVYMGSNGRTSDTMRQKLNLPQSLSETQDGIQQLFQNIKKKSDEVDVKIINRLYINRGSSINQQFKQILNETFKSSPEQVDFSHPRLPSQINNFLASATDRVIEEMLPNRNAFEPLTKMVLLSAVTMKSAWDSPFIKANTKELDFHVNDQEKFKVLTMKKEFNAKYVVNSNLGATLVEIPYKGKRTNLLIVVPTLQNGLSDVENKIKMLQINSLMNNATNRDVRLFLPRFKIVSAIDLKSTISKIGLSDIFVERAEFKNITQFQLLKLSKVLQKTVIQVQEEGTGTFVNTAVNTAATTTTTSTTTNYIDIKADHPFLFYILHRTSSNNNIGEKKAVVLFNGRVKEPRLNF